MGVMTPSLPIRVRTLRRKLGLSQRALAEHAGVALMTVNNMETGTRASTFRSLVLVATALGVQPTDLLAEVRPTRSKQRCAA